jgi:hypothetical protein
MNEQTISSAEGCDKIASKGERDVSFKRLTNDKL